MGIARRAVRAITLYGGLSALILAVYLTLVLGLGSLVAIDGRAAPWLAVIATVAVALLFDPAKHRLEWLIGSRQATKRMRSDRLLAHASRILAAGAENVLQEVAEAVAEAVGAPAEVWVTQGGPLTRVAATAPAGPGTRSQLTTSEPGAVPGTVMPILLEGEVLGEIVLRGVHQGALRDRDRRLLAQLAAALGLALRNRRLSLDLREEVTQLEGSRKRLEALQTQARRALERDLHDGAQQRLVAIKVRLGVARMREHPPRVAELLRDTDAATDRAISSLREFASGMRPRTAPDEADGAREGQRRSLEARWGDQASDGTLWLTRTARVLAVGSALGVAYGILTLVAIGRTDHLVSGYVLHLALPALAYALFTWLAISNGTTNASMWILAVAGACTSLGTAGWGTAVLVAQRAGHDVSLVSWNALAPVDVPTLADLSWLLTYVGAVPGYFTVLTLGLLVFPDGRLATGRWRWVAAASVVVISALLVLLFWAWRPSSTVPFGSPTAPGAGRLIDPLFLILVVLAVASLARAALAYRHSRGLERGQYRWIAVGAGTLTLLFVATSVTDLAPGLLPPATKRFALLAGLLTLIVSYGVAVARYQLHDVELVISRAAKYGALVACLAAGYVAFVVIVGGLVGAGLHSHLLSLMAMSAVAVTFQPAQRRGRHWANVLVFGDRARRYEALAALTRRLASMETPERDLSEVVRLLGQAVGAESAAVWTVEDGTLRFVAGWPQSESSDRTSAPSQLKGIAQPVTEGGELVGVLQVTMPGHEHLTREDGRMLEDAAASLGLILRNHLLHGSLERRAAELRSMRHRLVKIEDRERRRVEAELRTSTLCDIQELVRVMKAGSRRAESMGCDDAAELLGRLADEGRAVLTDVTAVARGLHPQMLDDSGLAPALRAHFADSPVPVQMTVNVPEPLAPEVRSTLYFVTLEAVSNALKHASPTQVNVAIRQQADAVQLEVRDDGVGLDPGRVVPNRGLQNIRDRVEAMGGIVRLEGARHQGTVVTALVPIHSAAVGSNGTA